MLISNLTTGVYAYTGECFSDAAELASKNLSELASRAINYEVQESSSGLFGNLTAHPYLLAGVGIAVCAGAIILKSLYKNPLKIPAQYGLIQTAELLLEKKAQINLPDASGATPLHHAVSANQRDMVELLLKKKAQINIPDISGAPPLFYAAKSSKQMPILQMLLDNGAERDFQIGPWSWKVYTGTSSEIAGLCERTDEESEAVVEKDVQSSEPE